MNNDGYVVIDVIKQEKIKINQLLFYFSFLMTAPGHSSIGLSHLIASSSLIPFRSA